MRTAVQSARNQPALATGLVLLSVSLVANVWVVEQIASPDGQFDVDTKTVLWVVNLSAAALGIWLVWRRESAAPVRIWGHFESNHPRVAGVLIRLFVLVLFQAVAEIVFYNLNERPPKATLRYDVEGFQLYEPYLGYRPTPNVTTTGTMQFNNEEVYQVTYSFDEYGRRVTPDPFPEHARDAALLVFGGSFAFGWGVEGDETIGSGMAKRLPDVRVYNYAYGGWAAQHMLALLEQSDFADQVEEREVRAIYVFMPAHIGRTTGSFRNVRSYGRLFPCYERDSETGAMVRVGSFEEAHPWQMAIYDVLAKEQIARYIRFDFPPIGRSQLERTADIIAQAKQVLEQNFDSIGFEVIIYPEHPKNRIAANAIVPYLEERGVDVLDYSTLFDLQKEGYLIPREMHPNARAHAELADAIVDSFTR